MDRPMLFRCESGRAVVVSEIVGIDGTSVLLSGGHKVAVSEEDIDQILELFQVIGNVIADVEDGTWKPEMGV